MPTPEARTAGQAIKEGIESKWTFPEYYYHLQPGGHVSAIRSHLPSSHFLRVDIQDFFGSINRTRVTRCLRPYFGYKLAREWAVHSTVRVSSAKGVTHLPYGFIQSPLLASVCLFRSALGRYLNRLHNSGEAVVSVYVDDILVSGSDHQRLASIYAEIAVAARRARLSLNQDKSVAPAREISAFNILLSEAAMKIDAARLAEFAAALADGAAPTRRQGILNYVASVCPEQARDLGTRQADG